MVAYFAFHEFLILLFIVLTITSLPSMYIYSKFNEQHALLNDVWGRYEMSNLGFSSSVCKEVALGVGKLSLHCDTGTIQ